MYNNINGYTSKKESLAKIVESVDPDILALCETKKARGIKEDELSAYEIIEKTLKVGKEGLMVGVRKGSFTAIREVTDTELDNLLTVKITYPSVTVRIIMGHAPQETDPLELRQEFYEELAVQVERCITSGDELVVVGDLNARIKEEGGSIIPLNESPNGKMVVDLLQKYSLKVANFHNNCDGKWTRIQPCKDGTIKKSVLDYVLLQQTLYDKLLSLFIDEEKICCPYRVKVLKGMHKQVYSDHCTFVVEFEIDVGHVPRSSGKSRGWKFSDEGLQQYFVESEPELLFESGEKSSTKIYGSWVVAFEKLLAKCFRIRTFSSNKGQVGIHNKKCRHIRSILCSISKRGKIQREVVKQYQNKLVEAESSSMAEVRAERLKKTTANLTAKERFSPTGYWKMKKAADKGTRKEQTLTSIITDSGVEVDGEKAIMEAYKEEFERRLANREPEEGWEEYTEDTNNAVRNWLQSESHSTPPFSDKEMESVLASLKEDSSAGVDRYPPKLFTKAGAGVVRSIKLLCNRIKELKDVPEQWNLVKITTIYKKKGSKKVLKYYRGIFLTIVISKIFEKLIKARIDDNLKKVNLLQAGSRKNRGPADNVFLFRGVMDHFRFTKRPLFVTAYDFEQAFDSLWLEDCVLSLNELGVEKEYLQLIYNLNKQAGVIVQTPFGDTSIFQTDPIVKQGTVLGPCLCSSSTGEYCGQNSGVCVGCTIISSLLYVDDVIDLSCLVQDYLSAHQNALLFKKRKKLTHSGTKCFSMVMNQNQMDEDLPVLMLDDNDKVILSKEITYLGDIFNSLGNNDGLIADRLKRGTKAMITIASLMAETEVGIHYVSIMLLLYRALFLSTILFNSSTWSNLRKKDLDSLRKLQLKFLKRIVGVASSTCNAFVYLELGVLPIDFEIEKRQLMYLHRILQLEPTDPVWKLFWELVQMSDAGEKNWWTGVKPLLCKYDLPTELNEIKVMSKDTFAGKVKASVTTTALHHLVAECQSLKKTANLQYNELKVHEYLTHLYPSQARLVFKWRSKTLDLKAHLSYKYSDMSCRICKSNDETPEHALNCGVESVMDSKIDVLRLDKFDDFTKSELKQMILRISSFLEKVVESD